MSLNLSCLCVWSISCCKTRTSTTKPSKLWLIVTAVQPATDDMTALFCFFLFPLQWRCGIRVHRSVSVWCKGCHWAAHGGLHAAVTVGADWAQPADHPLHGGQCRAGEREMFKIISRTFRPFQWLPRKDMLLLPPPPENSLSFSTLSSLFFNLFFPIPNSFSSCSMPLSSDVQ